MMMMKIFFDLLKKTYVFYSSGCQTWAPEFGQSCCQSAHAPSGQPAQPEGREQGKRSQRQHCSQGRQWLGIPT